MTDRWTLVILESLSQLKNLLITRKVKHVIPTHISLDDADDNTGDGNDDGEWDARSDPRLHRVVLGLGDTLRRAQLRPIPVSAEIFLLFYWNIFYCLPVVAPTSPLPDQDVAGVAVELDHRTRGEGEGGLTTIARRGQLSARYNLDGKYE